ncbi:MAG: CD1375 family protein [Peptostreptococcus sp.]|uniref:CD1375 family protein n=1 Tax=Peptostreptococcus sp. TaxID=1262 RepID=UPI0028FEF7A6|nr:CD1375 family protein [Peptostreptococcus sp.]MDU1266016.1 CD1375 family protein [Peptostreptococcus sp.]
MKNLIDRIRFFFYCIKVLLRGGESDMAMCYVTCIVAGVRTYKQVPNFLKAKVKELLIAMDLGELVKED